MAAGAFQDAFELHIITCMLKFKLPRSGPLLINCSGTQPYSGSPYSQIHSLLMMYIL